MNELNQNINFQGNLYEVKLSIYEKLMSPLAKLKKIFESIYSSLLKIIWAELIRGEKVDDEITSFVLFIVFCALSLLSYYFQNYVEIIIIALAIFWNLDYLWAKNNYFHLKPRGKVFIKGNDIIQYKLKLSKNDVRESTINLGQIKYISLKQREIEKGAFQEIVGTIWQMSLITNDHSIYIINEAKDLNTILESGHKLKNQLNIPLIFAESQGNNEYADFYLQRHTWQKPKNIKCRTNQQKWHIYSQWNLHNFWSWLQQIFSESGFFFFVLIMSAFMIKFGSWVEFFLSSFLNIDFPVLQFYTPQELFSPEIGLSDWIELSVSICLMIIQGWKISQNKHVYINKYFCKFVSGNKQIAQFATKQIKSILLLTKPQLEILIFDNNKYLRLEEFQQKEELQEMVYQLESAVNNFTGV